jgi:hypothetical protein
MHHRFLFCSHSSLVTAHLTGHPLLCTGVEEAPW